MKTIPLIIAAALTLAASAQAQPIYRGGHHPVNHPPPIHCTPPKVARMVHVVTHHQPRPEWRCVRP